MFAWHRFAVLLLVGACSFNEPLATDAGNTPTEINVAFETASSSADEMSNTLMIGVVLSGAPSAPVTVAYSVGGGTATPSTDFTVTSSILSFGVGEIRQEIPVTINSDSDEAEANETIVLVLGSPTGAVLGIPPTHTITINNELLPRVQFMSVTTATAEATQTMVAVTLDKAAAADSSITLAVTGTATAVTDFAIADGTVVMIPQGATTAMVPIGEVGDALDEDDETVIFGLTSPSANILVGTLATSTHTITDDDAPPVVQFAIATSSAAEDAGTPTISVTLSAPSGKTVEVDFARNNSSTAGADDATVVGAPGTLTFTPGDVQEAIAVTIADDGLDENAEVVNLGLTAPQNATLGALEVHAMTITDNDNPPTVSFELAASNVDEATTAVTVNVTLSSASARNISVPFTVDPASTASDPLDYSISTTPLSFPAGTLTRTITLDLVDDGLDELDEDVIITLGTPTNATLVAPSTHTFTINDNDGAVIVSWDPTQLNRTGPTQVLEGEPGTPVQFTYDLVLSDVSGQTVTVPLVISGDADDPADFSIAETLPIVFAPGETRKTITIDHVVDNVNEFGGDQVEDIIMTISATPTNAARGAPFVRIHSILDDD